MRNNRDFSGSLQVLRGVRATKFGPAAASARGRSVEILFGRAAERSPLSATP